MNKKTQKIFDRLYTNLYCLNECVKQEGWKPSPGHYRTRIDELLEEAESLVKDKEAKP